MNKERFIVLLCACAIAVAGLIGAENEDPAACSGGNTHRITILDLQSIVASVLHPALPPSQVSNENGTPNVLFLQRVLAHAQECGRPAQAPRTRPACKASFFRYQSTRCLEPLETNTQVAVAEPAPEHSHRWTRPARDITPTVTERYLFRLTSNAPPRCA